MAYSLDPGLLRDLTEAKADLTRHGIVIIRTIETELAPALVAEARSSMASSPKKMRQMEEDDLDRFLEKLRKSSTKEAEELKDLYVRLLAKLGTEYIGDLVNELDGIDQLFKWQRVAQVADLITAELERKGFGGIEFSGPEVLSKSFELELEQKWPAAFARFKALAEEAARQIERQEMEEAKRDVSKKMKKTPRKG